MSWRGFTASFTEVAVTAQQDLFQIEAQTVPARLVGLYLSQTSDVGDASAEGLSILIRRVTDAVTNDITEAKLDNGSAAANANLAVNETTELVTGATTIHADSWVLPNNLLWLPTPEMYIVVEVGNTVVVNLNTTPADSLTMSGTLYFQEIGS